MRDQYWYLQADCFGKDPNFWTIQPAYYDRPRIQNAYAIKVCRTCPVQTECMREALAVGDHGVIRAGVMLHTPQEAATCVRCHKPFLRAKRKRPRQRCRRNICSAARRRKAGASA